MDPHSIVDWREIFTDILKFVLGIVWVSGRKLCRDLNQAFRKLRDLEDRLKVLEDAGKLGVQKSPDSSSHEGGHQDAC